MNKKRLAKTLLLQKEMIEEAERDGYRTTGEQRYEYLLEAYKSFEEQKERNDIPTFCHSN